MESFVRRKLGEADIVGLLSSQQSFGLQNIGCVQLATFYAILSTKILKFKLGLFSLDSQIELSCMHDNALVMYSARSTHSLS